MNPFSSVAPDYFAVAPFNTVLPRIFLACPGFEMGCPDFENPRRSFETRCQREDYTICRQRAPETQRNYPFAFIEFFRGQNEN